MLNLFRDFTLILLGVLLVAGSVFVIIPMLSGLLRLWQRLWQEYRIYKALRR